MSEPKKLVDCGSCGGQGEKVVRDVVGPFTGQDRIVACNACSGRGKVYR